MAKKKKSRTSQSYKHSVGVPLGTTVQVPRVVIRSMGRSRKITHVPQAATFKRIAIEKYRKAVRERYLPPAKPLDLRSVGKIAHTIKSINPLKRIRAVIPRPGICIKRAIRAEVLHALGKQVLERLGTNRATKRTKRPR